MSAMNFTEWQQFVQENGNDVLIDGKTLARDWPDCPTPDCGAKVCIWAEENLCYLCSVAKIGRDEVERRYTETHQK